MEISKYKKLPYPLNLWSVVLKRTIHEQEIPHDWDTTLSFLFDSLNDPKKVEILLLFFKDKKTFSQISRLYKTSYSTTRQNLERSILLLQEPPRIYILQCGIEKATFMQENKLGYWGETSPLWESNDFASVLALPFDVLGMSTRPYNCLRRMGIEKIGQLVSHSRSELLMFRTMGTGTVDEITRCLTKHQLFLRQDPDSIT